VTSDDRKRLKAVLLERSVRRGDFTLASGAHSSYYVDARTTTMSGIGQMLIGRLGLEALDEAGWRPRAIGGLTLGADPVAYAIAHAATLDGRELDAFTVRKQAKDHGTGRRIEGGLDAGTTVVVTEDVVTTGGSALRAIEAMRSGCPPGPGRSARSACWNQGLPTPPGERPWGSGPHGTPCFRPSSSRASATAPQPPLPPQVST
jgi:orotate phosphoribosyltransferase